MSLFRPRQNVTVDHYRNIASVLTEARRIIEDPRNWYKGSFAVDKTGMTVPYYGYDACAFCARGAIKKAASRMFGKTYKVKYIEHVMERAMWFLGAHLTQEQKPKMLLKEECELDDAILNLTAFNDDRDRSHSEIMDLFDVAIKEAEKRVSEAT